MLRVIAIDLDEDAPLHDPRIAEAVALAVSSLNPDPFFKPDGSLDTGRFDPGDVVIADTPGRVLRVVQYEVDGETNVVDVEPVPWF